MDIKELGPIGAELTNLDLTQLSKEDIPHIRQSFLDYGAKRLYIRFLKESKIILRLSK